ncbi:MAG: hypothetical protein HC822_19985 [Oscillochloris sp.]|nr:hypothetical protein [Oscillochloris sp.]
MTYRLLTLIDWALISVSLFNTIAMLWLGLIVLLTAERRTPGTIAAAGGLIMGGLFFAGHSAVVGRVIGDTSSEMIFYWRLGWLVLIVAPFLWYAVMAWYAGALKPPGPAESWLRGERLRLTTIGILGAITFGLALFIDPLPSYSELRNSQVGAGGFLGSTVVVRLLYPGFATLCIVLALVVLRRPFSSDRFMGDLARRRARPWLFAASLLLLAICLVVGIGSAWFLDVVRAGLFPTLTAGGLIALIAFDLTVCVLVAGAIVLIGQAVVAYEVFTGQALPRGELARQWRRALALAVGYGLLIGWSLSGAGIPAFPIYQLILATLISTVFFALLSWRTFAERERTIDQLRPFVVSQHLYERLTGLDENFDDADADAFRALGSTLLGARSAYLLPYGPPATLAGSPLSLNAEHPAPIAAANQLAAELPNPPPLYLAVDPARFAGAIWAVPLLGKRDIIGLLLLGPKHDDGVYTREEIEVGRAAAERMIDARAGAEIARRLVALQRRRLAESQVIDRRTRRVLHDDVLPLIHTTLLQVADEHNELDRAGAINSLQAAHRRISDLLHALPPAAGEDLQRLGLIGALRRALHADLSDAFDAVHWDVTPAVEAQAAQLDPIAAEAIYYAAREAARNAARHGRGETPARSLLLTVRAAHVGPVDHAQLQLEIADDGVGISATPATTRRNGHGLALHGTVLAILGGALEIESADDHGTCVRLRIPLPAKS